MIDEDATAPSAAAAVPPAQGGTGFPDGLDARRRRLLFRATHRGTKETDRLLGGFVAPRIASLTEAELDEIERIMDLPDVDLADWLMGRVPLPPEHDTPMLRRIGAVARPPEKS